LTSQLRCLAEGTCTAKGEDRELQGKLDERVISESICKTQEL
jgi:hypothetical protein